jgi:hypothetical protein
MAGSSCALIRSAYAFVFSHWAACWRALWLLLALVFLLMLAIGLRLACLVSTAPAGWGWVVELVLWLVLLGAGLLVLLAMMQAVLWRFVLRAVPVLFYPGLGADEWRLMALGLLKTLVMAMAGAVAVLVLGLVVIGISRLLGYLSLPIVLIALALAVIAIGLVGTRFSLAGPAAIATRRLGLGTSWHVSRRRIGWLRRIEAGTRLPILLLGLAVLLLGAAWIVTAPGVVDLPVAFATLPIAQACAKLWQLIGPRLLALLLVLYLVALLFLSVATVAQGLAYRAATGAPPP